LLYRALDLKKTKLPVRMLRKFKQEFGITPSDYAKSIYQ